MSSHLWLAPLDKETLDVFATAFTISAKKRGYRVSTERFLAALPDKYKAQMMRLCMDAQSDCKMSVSESDLPTPELPSDWQEKICFSTCIESSLIKCSSQTNVSLVTFLKLLCETAVRLHCIVDRNLPINDYLKTISPINDYLKTIRSLPITPSAPTSAHPQRWQSHPASTLSVDDHLGADVLQTIMSKACSIEALRTCKAVCTSWRSCARRTLCDTEWHLANQISVHDMLKKGDPSPCLVVALAARRPMAMLERDGEGLLPLQYAAAYRMSPSLVNTIREATASQRPGSAAWANTAEARSVRSLLRPVSTRVAHAPIAMGS